MPAPRDPLFVAPRAYRRRRLIDVARVLPFAGAFLLLLPALWGGEGPIRTAAGGVYVFAVWAGLIVASALVSHLLAGEGEDDGPGER